jgi:hypothetical protein
MLFVEGVFHDNVTKLMLMVITLKQINATKVDYRAFNNFTTCLYDKFLQKENVRF